MATGDSSWVDVQKSTFTRWANNYLAKKKMPIDDLYEDLQDGIRLITLLQVISKEKVARRYNRTPKMRIQKLENLNSALDFMRQKGVMVTNIGSSDILDGNNKLVLGLMWTIIKSFQVGDIDVDGVSGKEGLLLWCKRSLSEYENVEMKNFTKSWTDGLAFCGLIHKFYPNQLPHYDQLTSENAQENVELAFGIMMDKFKVPRLLNVADVANNPKPDEKSIVTYVALLFAEFASGLQKQKAIATIKKAVQITQRHEVYKSEYDAKAKDLLKWLQDTIENFVNREPISSLQDVKEALSKFHEYKKSERPAKDAEFVSIHGTCNRLITSCRNSGRPSPIFDITFESLQELHNQLDDIENQYESTLRSDFKRFSSMELIINKVQVGSLKVEEWYEEKEEYFVSVMSDVKQTAEAEAKLESLEFFANVEYPRYTLIFKEVSTLAKDLSHDHGHTQEILAKLDTLEKKLSSLEEKTTEWKSEMEVVLVRQKELDQIMKECTTLMRNLHFCLEEIVEELETPLQEETVAAAQAAQQKFTDVMMGRIQSQILDVYDELQSKLSLLKEGRELSTLFETAELTPEKTGMRVEILQQTCEFKKKELEATITRLIRQDELCQHFASLVKCVKDKCHTMQDQMSENEQEEEVQDDDEAIVIKKLEKQLTLIRSLYNENVLQPKDLECQTSGFKQMDLNALTLGESICYLEKCNEELESDHVFTNPYTMESIHSIRSLYSSLDESFTTKIQTLDKDIAIAKSGNLTPEQVAEIKEVFDHFDSDQNGVLTLEEFIGACKGLGLSMTDEEMEESFEEMDTKGKQEVKFDLFSKFCASQLESGSSESDVRDAFAILTRDDKNITTEQFEEYFDESLGSYMKQHMNSVPEMEETYDYDHFSSSIFKI